MSDQDENLSLFELEELSLSQLDEYASELEDESIKWPEDMRQMYDIIKVSLRKSGGNERLTIALVSAICHHFGGMPLYIGTGDALRRHLRDLQIWDDFNGKNVRELIRKYNVGYAQIYRIIGRMRKRETQKRQHSLF